MKGNIWRLVVTFISVLMLTLLVGCGGDDTGTEEVTQPTEAPAAAEAVAEEPAAVHLRFRQVVNYLTSQ